MNPPIKLDIVIRIGTEPSIIIEYDTEADIDLLEEAELQVRYGSEGTPGSTLLATFKKSDGTFQRAGKKLIAFFSHTLTETFNYKKPAIMQMEQKEINGLINRVMEGTIEFSAEVVRA